MPVRSPWPSMAPYPREPIWEFLARAAQRLPDKPALLSENGSICTYQDLWDTARRVAHFLQRETNVRRGETVAIIAPSSCESAATLYGALLAGARVMPLNALLREQELAYYLAHSEAVVVFASALAMRKLETTHISAEPGQLRKMYSMRGVNELVADNPPYPEPVPIDPAEDIAFLVYSSGTTGVPTAIMHTHAGMRAVRSQRMAVEPLGEDAVILSLRPIWVDLSHSVAEGATAITFSRFDPETLLALMNRYQVTDVIARPTALDSLLQCVRSGMQVPSSLRLVESSGAPLSLPAIEQLRRNFRVPLVQSYQLTEACSANRTPRTGQRTNSVGLPMPDTEEMVVDPETGAELGPGEVGELLIRGPQVMKGYWRDPEATAAAFLPGGWLRTGDLARFDEDGYLYIVDRLKALIKVGDWPVYPAEIETVLSEHPAVLEAAVVPRPADARGEVPVAFVVLREGHAVEPDALRALVASCLAKYKVPQSFEFVAELPRNPGGKVLRRVLVERARSQERGPGPVPR